MDEASLTADSMARNEPSIRLNRTIGLDVTSSRHPLRDPGDPQQSYRNIIRHWFEPA